MTNLEQHDDIAYEVYLKGLSEETIRGISRDLQEPQRMLEHRLKCYNIFLKSKDPKYGPDISSLNYENIVYYAKPKKDFKGYSDNRDQVPEKIKNVFARLKIPEAEQQYLAGVGGQYDSSVVYHRLKEQRLKSGIIFEDMSEAIKEYPDIVQQYFMKLVPPTDHKFTALHGAVRSGGTFIYIPKGIKLTDPLQAYFRMNTLEGGQFEHTLIILEDDTQGDYIEGCSAPKYDQKSIHAGCVEIYVGKNAKMRYSSVENRSLNTFNLNTKRALVEENSFMERIGGNLGSGGTMLYPCSILKGDNSKSDNISVVVASKDQNQDVGAKVIHIGKNTSSNIVSKSISKDGGITTYRGLVDIRETATNAVTATECDALLLDTISVSETIPVIKVETADATVSHEASAGKIDIHQMFYLMSRGLPEEKAMAMIVNGFISGVVKKLPMEYAGELNHLIEMEMEGSIG
ncbi:MAG: Fe-S cluster assembly protein SufB [Candidatus Absconditabacteria bacterium]|nr:Fe-S cluster assembly protein SufB [Candidatus Absconditabacteria bacterium]MDD3868739.1 Fe-S cluster assembly protein SufB [Candidatus Absconditabacteria bacterium]MDD4714368.1 Fe-S cluster assembly protein SufB [Candidatus Absconditabacteria bacterium]